MPKLTIQEIKQGMSKIQPSLKSIGFDAFRPGQERSIRSIIMGVNTMTILSTGSGKTLLGIIPTLAMDWKTVVFSPLVSLMRDRQVQFWSNPV